MKVENKQDLLIKKLAKQFNIDYRVCKEIVNSPFSYLKYIVTSDTIERGVRIPYFGAFCQKGEYKNKTMRTETRKNILIENLDEVAIMMVTTLGFVFSSHESAKSIIDKAWEIGDYEKINMIWDGWKEYSR